MPFQVEPFASLVTLSRHTVPRLLLNRELVGPFRSQRRRPTDVAVCRDVVESVRQLAQGAGWAEELDNIHREVTGSSGKGMVLQTHASVHVCYSTSLSCLRGSYYQCS